LGVLYVVGTPIGNLDDITLRALRVLAEVDLIAAEDTRSARVLLSHHGIRTPVTSFHDFSSAGKGFRLIERMKAGADVAIISEAGMPAISDPGYSLIRQAIESECEVTCVPGPSAVLVALVLSGLPAHAFRYIGFLPRKAGERLRMLQSLSEERDTLICFESPHRLVASLRAIVGAFGADRRIGVARELTKRYEEVLRLTTAEAVDHFEQTKPRGEFTLVIAGAERASGSGG